MECRNGMPVWAPDETELRALDRHVRRLRAEAFRDTFRAIGNWFSDQLVAGRDKLSSTMKTAYYN